MTIHDVGSLAALIAAYDKAVAFEGSLPSAFQLAKLFPELHRTNGGIVLLGVRPDGTILGIDPAAIDGIYARFEHLCRELTNTRVEMGTLHVESLCVVFLVFNTIPRNTDPLSRYCGKISRLEII